MSAIHRPLRLLVIVALVGVWLVTGAPNASAHAGIASSTPANGAQLSGAPKAVTLVFEEKVTLNGKGTRIIDGEGKTVPSVATATGRKVVLVPKSPLAPGRYAAAWHLISVDKDAVDGAISFTVATANPRGKSVVVDTLPRVPTILSAALPGHRKLTFTTRAKTGDVEWTSAGLTEPITWSVKGNGKTARASGVLPQAGTWSFTATLVNGTGVVIVKGKVTLVD